MRRKRDRSHVSLSLFPFLSVLVSVTGALSLIVTGMTLVSLQGSEQVVTLAMGGSSKQPDYVECRKDGLLLHPQGTPVATADIEKKEGPWNDLLTRIEGNRDGEYLILLVRPDGVDAFDAAYAAARGRKIDVGYDPVYAAGPISFRKDAGGKKP